MRKIALLGWQKLSIRSRLIFITIGPFFILFISLIGIFTHIRSLETKETLSETGKVYAQALAKISEYGVLSENIQELSRDASTLLVFNENIRQIFIYNKNNTELVSLNNQFSNNEKLQCSFSPVIYTADQVHIFLGTDSQNRILETNTKKASSSIPIGSIKICISSEPSDRKQDKELYLITLVLAIALTVTILLIFVLSKNITTPLLDAIQTIKGIHPFSNPTALVVSEAGEIGDLQIAINKMSKNLWEATQVLERKVNDRTLELQTEKDKVSISNLEKRNLIKKQNSVVEEDRRKMAIDIHDHLNASHIGIKLETQRILKLASGSNQQETLVKIQEHAASVINQTIELIDISRKIVKKLRPEIIDILGLKDALDEMCKQYTEISTVTKFTLITNGNLKPLDIDLAICAYRLVQEALSNVIKHSNAEKCRVNVSLDGGILTVIVQDDGVGFDVDSQRIGIGLVGMEERAYAFRGTVQFSSSVLQGTTIIAILPNGDDFMKLHLP